VGAGSLEAANMHAEQYARQVLIPGWGEAGQERLRRARVVVAGAGGLGCPLSTYLAVAGVGELRLCDPDCVAVSNLNRQIHYTAADVGRPKVEVAAARLRALNPAVSVLAHRVRLDADSLPAIAAGADLVVDCLDNFAGRYVLNAYCVRHRLPLLHAGVWGLGGQLALLLPPRTACLRCVFPEPPPAAPATGSAGLVGAAQAVLALRWLTGMGVEEAGRLLVLEGEPLAMQQIALRRVPGCPDCGA